MTVCSKKIAILQPNYIPWKGVFDLISRVDIFVFYDDVQYTLKDWRSRNKIKTPNGDLWLSVPVFHKGKKDQLICDAVINQSTDWQKNHYKSLKLNYSKARYFKEYEYLLEAIYLKQKWEKIADLNIFSTKLIAEALGIHVQWERSSQYNFSGSKHGDKVVKMCQYFECDHFINGPASKQFMDDGIFKEANVKLDYIEYHYDEYPQLYKPFNHNVTVLDVLFHCGPQAKGFVCKGVSSS